MALIKMVMAIKLRRQHPTAFSDLTLQEGKKGRASLSNKTTQITSEAGQAGSTDVACGKGAAQVWKVHVRTVHIKPRTQLDSCSFYVRQTTP